MKNNDDIPTTDTTEIKQLINRVKQGKLDQGDALLTENLLNFLLTIVPLLQRKHTSIRRIVSLRQKSVGPNKTCASAILPKEHEHLFNEPSKRV